MAKISMVVPDTALAEIDSSAQGNRTSFMISAALDRARELQRAREDAEIAALSAANAELDRAVAREWAATGGDGLA
jgi:hypothetical protein